MTTRQPLQTLPPPSANVINTRYAHLQRPASTQDDVQDAASVGSALSDLENDAEDEFEKRMIQNARDERRLNQALGSRPQAFRKARTHPRVGLTLDNLERNNAVAGADGHVKFESPPSSTGSARSDPAIHAPATWGRKSRSNRNWMRTITYEEEQQQTPERADDTIHDHYDEAHANVPRRSVEDSPLSHKGTPRNDQSQEWDLTFELNEASMIASTPYIPRNTVLDDIRQREMQSVKEQAATARLERMRQGSPEQSRPRTSSIRTVDTVDSSARITDQVTQPAPSPKRRLRTRTHSWQSIGKAQPVTGIGMEDPPVAMYKSAENIATVDREVVATAQPVPPRRIPNRREDSQDLLRRLARVSNTPSPRQAAPSRPESAPPAPLDSAPQTVLTETTQSESKPASVEETPVSAEVPDAAAATSIVRQEHTESREAAASTEHVEATPMPKERPALNPKTPVVTGAWVDTPGPRTVQRPAVASRSRSLSPKKGSPRKQRPSEKAEEPSEAMSVEPVRPQLPKSALQALVDEAKSQGRRPSADFGDSTINSLEDLIAPSGESQIDEDTLQGLQLPTETPRNEAERQRQQELLHLHRMNDRLRAARTSIRDASRGMKRVEDQVEHVEEGENGEKVKVTSNSWGRAWGGLTGLSIFLIILFTWWISEEIACEMYCQPMYAYSSPRPFSVNMKAPKFPFVIPTVIYRTFVQGWWVPISSFFSWIAATMWSVFFGFEEAQAVNYSASQTIKAGSTMRESHWISDEAAKLMEEKGWDHSMFEDEILPGGR
ncbi:uncharacterized protein J4E78_002004 [Alternaria triticimaculans]|uniref:uncharacterized protein n=1 Tax=Alternaria triticimaculans TaxID=297637 RepID=UPI0020C2EA7D|nr:uncharacterized protein J4E78_002004 [Alternaria triticimaculans]KAI4668180.1 hypothetical protein J4E78_002004 [Alternaria triticimaculans]